MLPQTGWGGFVSQCKVCACHLSVLHSGLSRDKFLTLAPLGGPIPEAEPTTQLFERDERLPALGWASRFS